MAKKTETVKALAVRTHANVPGGVRRRAGLVFTQSWTHFAPGELPEEVAQDDYLVVREVQVSEEILRADRRGRPTHDVRAATEPTTSQTEPDQSDESPLDQLTGLDRIGLATGKKLLAGGIDRQALEQGTARAAALAAVLTELQPAQQAAVLDATTPELREQLKAERIQ